MKISKYTILFEKRENYCFYNSLNDKVMLCLPEVKDLIEKYHSTPDALEPIHPELYGYLKENRFLVPDDEDETKLLIEKLAEEQDSEAQCSITVNPTMNCNLRCWYCYEDHLPASMMNGTVLEAVKKMIALISTNEKTKEVHLNFFGGEPLLGFNQCVKPLIEYTQNVCAQHNKTLSIGFTSNAVLLTEPVTDFLSGTGLHVYMQIPFDGNRTLHNTIKKRADGSGTYDTTLKNAAYAVSKGIHILVRCNYTAKSVASFRELIDDMEPLRAGFPDRVNFAFQRVWQEEEKEDTNRIVEEMTKYIHALNGTCKNDEINIERCYADKRNSFVINYNGDVYQCTARNFLPENREGILRDDGTIAYNERYDRRMAIRFSNPACLDCKIFPICTICTQKRIEHATDRCFYHDPLASQMDVVRNRVSKLLEAKNRAQAEKKAVPTVPTP